MLGLVYELRRSLYGGLTEEQLDDFIQHGERLPNMRGLMGFYCLLDDPAPLKQLDGWMLNIVRRAMKTRNNLLSALYNASCPTPTNKQLATGDWFDPKAWRGNALPKKHFYTWGLENVEPPRYAAYSDNVDFFEY